MSNRQRLVAALVKQHLKNCATKQDVYLMERITPLYKWIANKHDSHSIVGSEYFGSDHQGGDIVGPLDYQEPLRFNNLFSTARHKFSLFYSMLRMGGIRHEDITRLSFPDTSLDLIVSNDVFEHVPDPEAAFRECSRVLRPGGLMFATIPFHSNSDISVVRAELKPTGIHHLFPPLYHGNPVSVDGSLVFTDFGWDIIKSFLKAGFSDGVVNVYWSMEYGHFGGDGQIIFRMTK
ncbi:MAG: methyltransferase domain-containing protein [Methylococcaceae bacterium]|nr:methyltransferase domain-containing protein [Methylococcaceae bacterium]